MQLQFLARTSNYDTGEQACSLMCIYLEVACAGNQVVICKVPGRVEHINSQEVVSTVSIAAGLDCSPLPHTYVLQHVLPHELGILASFRRTCWQHDAALLCTGILRYLTWCTLRNPQVLRWYSMAEDAPTSCAYAVAAHHQQAAAAAAGAEAAMAEADELLWSLNLTKRRARNAHFHFRWLPRR
jgi:hypothetical protein